jgi:16S rRNA A1518/A1519 N6-dimethyltransferase RsmA/KsgA/DIM1 with predicted DNA glycosylase/AP lyase activity
MTNFNNMAPLEAILMAYNFKPFQRVVDIGGGLGSLSGGIMKSYSHMYGTIFDMPNVVQEAEEVRSRC